MSDIRKVMPAAGAKPMATDIELLPLPEIHSRFHPMDWHAIEALATDYARANVEHHTAAKDAEIKALRERADKFKWQVRDTCVRAEKAEAQLAELRATLQGIADADYQEWDDGLNTPFTFVTWAKSRAAHAISTLAAADGGGK